MKIVTHGCVAMASLAIDLATPCYLKRGIQPGVKVGASLGMHTYIYSVRCGDQANEIA